MIVPCLPTVGFAADNGTAEIEAVFDDIFGHWAESEIGYLYRIGLVNGVTETEFAPDEYITRAEFIAMLVRGMGLEEDKYAAEFSDVAILDDWFAGLLGAAVNAGLIENSVQAFLPDGYIKREEAAVIAARAAELLKPESGNRETAVYNDISGLSEEAQSAVAALSEAQIMEGTSEGSFEPYGSLTRAEATGVVMRLMLASNAVDSVGADVSEAAENSGFTNANNAMKTSTEYSYLRFDGIYLTSNLNTFEAEISVKGDVNLELWSNSTDTLTGTLLGTIRAEETSEYTLQTAEINKTYGCHNLYLRFTGEGEIGIKSFRIYDNTFTVKAKNYDEISGLKKSGSNITDLKYGGYVEYYGVEFGKGYDTIELEMLGAREGDLIEVWLDDAVTDLKGNNVDLRAGIIETVKGEDGSIEAIATVVKCRDTQNVILKPLTDTQGSISEIKFYNSPTAAEIHLEAEDAETGVEFEDCIDLNGGKQTKALSDGDVLKFEAVQFGDGYNYIDVRAQVNYMDPDDFVLMLGKKDGSDISTGLIGFGEDKYDEGYLEVRLDSENGKLVGVVKPNPVRGISEYDLQSGELTGAVGKHDVYIKAVGEVGWKVNWFKLKAQGYYDKAMVALEAEDCENHNGTATEPNDVERFKDNSPEQESSGRRNVKFTEKNSYIDFVVPEWFDGGEDITITVRHSIPDAFDENDFSVGQTGEMEIYVNGEKRKAVMPYDKTEKSDTLQLTSEYMYGYRESKGAPGLGFKKGTLCSEYFDDAACIIEGEVKSGDVITLKPIIDDRINFCYIDMIELEKVNEKRSKPDNFLSIEDTGAVSNDGNDDAPALRAAIEEVQANPDKWGGVWIPEGYWEMKSFLLNHIGQKAITAYVDNVNILGAGLWHSRVQVDPCIETTINNWTFEGGFNTMMWDFDCMGSSKTREWTDGYSTIMIGSNGLKYGLNFKRVRAEHWNATVWGMHTIGVISHMRIKNSWADGINVLAKLGSKTDGATVEHNLIRSTADDGIAAFSPCPPTASPYENNVEYYTVRYNSVSGIYWGSNTSFWGTEHTKFVNNLSSDPVFISGLALQSTVGPHASRGSDDVLIKNNRFVRCGGRGNNHDNGAICIVQSWKTDDYDYNTKFKDTYIEQNDFIDNPKEVLYAWGGEVSDEVLLEFGYNYIRNVGLSDPGSEKLIRYDTGTVETGTKYRKNVLESVVDLFVSSNTTNMNDDFTDNYPYNWED